MWLVAEDETDIRVLITTMISVWGYQAVAFENGQKVWDWLDQIEADAFIGTLPDLVLMDIRMPGKKGNEVANRMRSIAKLDRTPIALMTAFSLSDGERKEMIDQDGVDTIISKPLPDFDQLRQLLQALIEKKKTPTHQNGV
ncbi:MAG: response regulator [Anaerolineae bacterium]|nr:response regulator [Anaerolineae bacterium]